jgi:type IV pilus assembly protein PilV
MMKKVRGVSLLEILIAVIVLAIGLLGLARLQTQALKLNHSAAQRSQAVMLAYYMMDAMRVNRDAAASGAYNIGSPSSPTCSAPTASGLAGHDLGDWFARLKENLGNFNSTCGMISCDGNDFPRCTVRIFWDDSRAGGATNQSIEITSQL